jgi:hypothetical protein
MIPKGFEPKQEMDEGQKKNLVKSIISDKEDPEVEGAGFNCPACGVRISVEAHKEAKP